MRALTFHAPREVRVESVAEPEIVDGGDAIVRVEQTAICGSDLHVYRGNEAGLDAGTVLGHEFVGVIEDQGDGVEGLRRGQRVVAPFTTSCGACFYCTKGLTSRCERGELFGWMERGQGLHGAQAEAVRVPLASSTLVAVPNGLDPALALLAGDVLATGDHAARAARFEEGAVVAVVGCGPVGLCAILAARERGAKLVVAFDPEASRRDLAETFGAESCDPSDGGVERAVAVVAAVTHGRGVDAVLECVGSGAATELAYALVRPGGTISAVGVHTEEHFAFAPGDAYDKNLTYVAGRCPARHGLEARLERLARLPVDLGRLYSHRLSLEEASAGYAMFDARVDGCTKVLLAP